MNRTRNYYEDKLLEYPEVVDLLTFRKMMGGMGDTFSRRRIHKNRVKHLFIKPRYWIFKTSVVDYLLSEDYANRRLGVRP